MYVTDQINSSESEGAFNEFVEEQLENLVDAILTQGDLEKACKSPDQCLLRHRPRQQCP